MAAASRSALSRRWPLEAANDEPRRCPHQRAPPSRRTPASSACRRGRLRASRRGAPCGGRCRRRHRPRARVVRASGRRERRSCGGAHPRCDPRARWRCAVRRLASAASRHGVRACRKDTVPRGRRRDKHEQQAKCFCAAVPARRDAPRRPGHVHEHRRLHAADERRRTTAHRAPRGARAHLRRQPSRCSHPRGRGRRRGGSRDGRAHVHERDLDLLRRRCVRARHGRGRGAHRPAKYVHVLQQTGRRNAAGKIEARSITGSGLPPKCRMKWGRLFPAYRAVRKSRQRAPRPRHRRHRSRSDDHRRQPRFGRRSAPRQPLAAGLCVAARPRTT